MWYVDSIAKKTFFFQKKTFNDVINIYNICTSWILKYNACKVSFMYNLQYSKTFLYLYLGWFFSVLWSGARGLSQTGVQVNK